MSAIALLVQAAQTAAEQELLTDGDEPSNDAEQKLASPPDVILEENMLHSVLDESISSCESPGSSYTCKNRNPSNNTLIRDTAVGAGTDGFKLAKEVGIKEQQSKTNDQQSHPHDVVDHCKQLPLIPSALLETVPLKIDVSQAAIEAALALSSVSRKSSPEVAAVHINQENELDLPVSETQKGPEIQQFQVSSPEKAAHEPATCVVNVYGGGGKRRGGPLRRGKWTPEEEAYANRLIQEFKAGLLPLEDGTTLRTFLSQSLGCDPMRISKKFVGSNCIGKQVFRRRSSDKSKITPERLAANKAEIAELEQKFLERLARSSRSRSSSLKRRASTPNSPKIAIPSIPQQPIPPTSCHRN